ncbi:MAG: hypothetical protein OEZ34_05820 [Spirochaetia bacterium]|nr:hypothetical protein [Spirochaetia bacterium]
MIFSITEKNTDSLYNLAFALSMITIAYNVIEGIVSVYFGIEDETLALFGFGLDSFVEVLSGIGIAHMILKIKKNPSHQPDTFEKTALRITGISFYILAVSIFIGILINLYTGSKPVTTFAGIIITLLSLISMYFLIYFKLKAGRLLKNDAIIADANCTKACLYLSGIVFLSSVTYEITGFPYVDAAGSLGVVYYAAKEGKESFDKIKGKSCGCDESHCSAS